MPVAVPGKPEAGPSPNQKTKVNVSALAAVGPEKQKGGAWRLFGFSFLIFIIMLSGYLGLKFGYRPFLENEVKKEQDKIQRLTSVVAPSEQERFRKLYFQLLNLEKILAERRYASKIFSLLQGLTHERVAWESMQLDLTPRQLSLNGYTPSYTSMVQQLDALDADPGISGVKLQSVSKRREDNMITFKVVITLGQNVLR